jgi:hypothetical protein
MSANDRVSRVVFGPTPQSRAVLLRTVVAASLIAACGRPEAEPTEAEPTEVVTAKLTGPITISGTAKTAGGVAIVGNPVRLSGKIVADTVTDSAGAYRFTGLFAGSYSVRPDPTRCSFTPDVVNLNNLSASVVKNFVGSGANCPLAQPTPAGVRSQALGVDLDLDDDSDALLYSKDQSLQAFKNQSGSLISIPTRLDPLLTAGGGRMAAGDLDLDGDPDVVVAVSKRNRVELFLNRWAREGKLEFTTSGISLAYRATSAVAGIPLLLDWDKDGDLDLIVAGSVQADWVFYRNDFNTSGVLAFTNVTTTLRPTMPLFPSTDAAVGDVDGDGYPDVIAIGLQGPALLRNNRGTGFVDETGVRNLVREASRTVSIEDFDNDGDGDVFVAGDAFVRLYLNNGPAFSRVEVAAGLTATPRPSGVATGDFNFDRLPDILLTSRDEGVAPRLMVSRGVVGGVPTFATAPTPAPLASVTSASEPSFFADTRLLAAAFLAPFVSSQQFKVAIAGAQAPDGDCDRMPDPWESAQTLLPLDPADQLMDPDADEVQNLFEYRFGYSAINAFSHVDGLRDDRSITSRLDLDGDGVADRGDNCTSLPNPTQRDFDLDGIGDLCDEDPEGTGDPAPRLVAVTAYKTATGLDTAYVGSKNRFKDDPTALRGYYPAGAGFRWFSYAADGLQPIYEGVVSGSNTHRYALTPEALTALGLVEPPEVVGFVSANPFFRAFGDLVLLRSFVLATSGQQALTTDNAVALALIQAGYQEQVGLGYVMTNAGENSEPVQVFELRNPANGQLRYTSRPEGEPDAATLTSAGRVFTLFAKPGATTVPLFRLVTAQGDHILTIDAAERQSLLGQGARDLGIAGYLFRRRPDLYPGEVRALERLKLPGSTSPTHAYTADRQRFEALLAQGAISEGTEGWVVAASARHPNDSAYQCTPAPAARDKSPTLPGRRLLADLRSIPDPQQRAIASFVTLTSLCVLKRAASGATLTAPEQQVRDRLAAADPETRKKAIAAGTSLDGITTEERAEVLGALAAADPGACTAAGPPPETLAQAAAVAGRFPRVRTASCADTLSYPGGVDPDVANRALTVGSFEFVPGFVNDGIPFPGVIVNRSRPFVGGIAQAEDARSNVSGHPALDRDRLTARNCGHVGDGYSPYGVNTFIPCSQTAPCDRESGLICGTTLNIAFSPDAPYQQGVCYAFPIVAPGLDVRVRGHNFWDKEEAKLQLKSITDRNAPAQIVDLNNSDGNGVISNEGPGPNDGSCDQPRGRLSFGSELCQPGSTANDASRDPGGIRTHNEAHFPVNVTPGQFYWLRMANHNGNLHHWGGNDAGRVVHTCYDPTEGVPLQTSTFTGMPIVNFANVINTRTSCSQTLPAPTGLRSCQDNNNSFLTCGASIWGTADAERPRPLSQCRHPVGTDPTCGETPEWIYSHPQFEELKLRMPIIFVSSNAAAGYKLASRLYGVRCFEESGPDWAGSDELSVITSAWISTNGALSASLGRWDGDEFDTTNESVMHTRLISPPSVASVVAPVGLNQSVSYTVTLQERDAGIWVAILAITVIVVVFVGIVVLCTFGGVACGIAAFLTKAGVIGGTALGGLALFWLLKETAGENDMIGHTQFNGTPALFGERYTFTHQPGFEDGDPPGTLPLETLSGTNPDRYENTLARANGPEFPNGITTRTPRNFNPLETESPGLKMIGFREWRRIITGDTDYLTQFLFQRTRCDTATSPDCIPPAVDAQDPTKP